MRFATHSESRFISLCSGAMNSGPQGRRRFSGERCLAAIPCVDLPRVAREKTVQRASPRTASVADRNLRYPDHLQRRLLGAGIPVSVVNAGISGNMLLT
ncbi:hypothetical protein Franean1_1627 [Parafrankia sp. EAN1pec]|nr:hypothetical protein Franean1_1627 [Frankia sp. EAN1pec]